MSSDPIAVLKRRSTALRAELEQLERRLARLGAANVTSRPPARPADEAVQAVRHEIRRRRLRPGAR